MRLRLLDFRESDGPASIGVCSSDVSACAKLANKIQRRLVFCREAGDQGWLGSWCQMAFTVSQDAPYLTTPRNVSRLIDMAVCNRSVAINNQFFEYLEFGIGPQSGQCCSRDGINTYTRNNVYTFLDIAPPNKKIRVYLTDANDTGKRVFISGVDNNNNIISELDNGVNVLGTFISLEAPFQDSLMTFNEITGISKDVTFSQVRFYEVDTVTGDQRLILTMEGGETVASYRRYFLDGLPKNCCETPGQPTGNVQVKALAKLELIDVVSDTDYLLLYGGGALEAMCQEAMSIRHSQIDNSESKKLSQEEHTQAIRLLQGQLVDAFGKYRPAISYMPVEAQSLRRSAISMV